MRIVVTGAAGFIGRRLCVALAAEGHSVTALLRPGHGATIAGADCLACDLATPGFTRLLNGPVDAVFHLAQSQRFREFPAGAEDMFAVNLQATFELMELARKSGARRFVYASSGNVVTHETAETERLGFYLSTKLASEILLDAYGGCFAPARLRIYCAYGPGQQGDRLVPRLLDAVRSGRPITLDGEDGLVMNPIYIDDVLKILLGLLASDAPLRLDLCGREVLSLRDIGNFLAAMVGRPAIFEQRPNTKPQRLVGNPDALERLGWQPSIGFGEGARQLAAAI